MTNVRAGFVTCVELGLSCVREIYDVGGSLDCLITLHDHIAPGKSGRVYLDQFAGEHGIPLFKLRNVNEPEAVEFMRSRELDWLFIIGWSQIARTPVLDSVRRGVLGMHPTLLPVGRGRASIPWAILKGLPETGVTLFQLDEGVDTGPILGQERIPLSPRETATELYSKVARAHRTLIRSIWPAIVAGEVSPAPQDHSSATVWAGRTPEDGRLHPEMTVAQVDALVRATTRPYPGAFQDLPNGRLRIWAGAPACDENAGGGQAPLRYLDGSYQATEWSWEPYEAVATERAT